MANFEVQAKNEIIKLLRSQGYATYAKLFDLFDVKLVNDPKIVAYMVPSRAIMVLNQNLTIEQVSTIVRHEILHEYLTHAERLASFSAKNPDVKPDQRTANIAADYEISNRGYTANDKKIVRGIRVGDQVLKGLVTEDNYPGWENKTFEEMYAELSKTINAEKAQLSKAMEDLLSDEELEKIIQELDKLADKIDDADKSGSGNQDGNEPGGDQGAAPLTRLDKAITGAQKAAEKATESNGSVFATSEEQEIKADIGIRITQIRDILSNSTELEAALKETDRIKDKEKRIAKAKDLQKYNQSAIARFTASINRFVRDQIATGKGSTWNRFNKTYAHSDILRPGTTRYKEQKIPKINVYLDVSPSFDDPAKTAAARAGIATLNKYVTARKLKIDLYYFAGVVSSERSGAGVGTFGQPILNHIEQSNPNNVIIITDSDIGDCSTTVTVPGAVWMLFYDDRSQNLIDHLKGKMETKYFDIEYDN